MWVFWYFKLVVDLVVWCLEVDVVVYGFMWKGGWECDVV